MLYSNPRESKIKSDKTDRNLQDPPPPPNRVHQQSHEMCPKSFVDLPPRAPRRLLDYRDEPSAAEQYDG